MDRCQWVTSEGQCDRAAVNGRFCNLHGPIKPDQALRHYHITNELVSGNHDRHTAVSQIKDMREEIALTRALIETRLNLAKDESEFIASMGILHQYLKTVETLVASCHKMDTSLGNILNKASVLKLAQELVSIIAAELEGIPGRDEIVDNVANRILECIGTANNEEKE